MPSTGIASVLPVYISCTTSGAKLHAEVGQFVFNMDSVVIASKDDPCVLHVLMFKIWFGVDCHTLNCRYEEQSVKVASLESMHRKQQRELLRSGGGVDSVSLASMSHPPQSHTPKLDGNCSRNWEADDQGELNRELFKDTQGGEENDATLVLTPTVAGAN